MDKQDLYNFPNDFPFEFGSTDYEQPCFSYKEPTLGRSGCSHSHAPLPPFTYKGGKDAWNLVYTSTGQLAQMKKIMSNLDVTSVPHAFNRPRFSSWGRSEGIELLPQQQFCGNISVFAWPSPQFQTRCHQHCPNRRKPIVGTYVKRACAGTGVFLPRRYCDNLLESRTQQEFCIDRSKAMILAAQQQRRRSNIHGVVMESALNNPAVLLPQEWTY